MKFEMVRQLAEKQHIISPNPIPWSDLEKLYRRKVSDNSNYPVCLILNGWWASNDFAKNQRFCAQLELCRSNLDETLLNWFFGRLNYEDFYWNEPLRLRESEKSSLQFDIEDWQEHENLEQVVVKFLEMIREINKGREQAKIPEWYSLALPYLKNLKSPIDKKAYINSSYASLIESDLEELISTAGPISRSSHDLVRIFDDLKIDDHESIVVWYDDPDFDAFFKDVGH